MQVAALPEGWCEIGETLWMVSWTTPIAARGARVSWATRDSRSACKEFVSLGLLAFRVHRKYIDENTRDVPNTDAGD
jgi:hypothetical protein